MNRIKYLTVFMIASCAQLPASRHDVRVVNLKELSAPLAGERLKRPEKYLNCIMSLSDTGIKQSLIKDLCNATYGSIE